MKKLFVSAAFAVMLPSVGHAGPEAREDSFDILNEIEELFLDLAFWVADKGCVGGCSSASEAVDKAQEFGLDEQIDRQTDDPQQKEMIRNTLRGLEP